MANNVLPPGFRFHPTDVELIMYWLKRKILGRKFHLEAISEVDINAYDPEDLPAKCCLKSGDREWFFFSPREKKGARAKRTTPTGFWKTTGIDRQVLYNGESMGKIKTLIFHIGKVPKAERTDWVMHEYCLTDPRLAERGIQQDAYVLCKIFQKDGLGPRNGAQYGALFREEEWDEEVDAIFPGSMLLPATAEPENQNHSTMETDINMLQSTGLGSLSEACPSTSVQHLLLPDDEQGYNDPRMFGFFLDEILGPPIENAENGVPLMYLQDQGNALVVQDNGGEVNEIFNDLPDLDYFRELMATGGPEPNPEGNQPQLVFNDSCELESMYGMFMELSDLDSPLHFPERFNSILDDPVVPEPAALPEGTNLLGPFQEIGAPHRSGYEAAASWDPCQGNVASGHKRARDENSLEDIGRMSKR